MPTEKSIILRDQVVRKLKESFQNVAEMYGKFKILSINDKKIYLRVTTEKSGAKYWFDIKKELYEQKMADILMYACGSSNRIYVFPIDDFARMISGASLGGVNQVPNFTIFLDSHKFEPAGRSDRKHDIKQYYNNFTEISAQELSLDLSRTTDTDIDESNLLPNRPVSSLEETLRRQYHYRIERNSQLAAAAKQAHGYTCKVCQFNYEKVYGDLGKNYIEAHHIKPLSELPANQTIKLSPKDDFAVLCSNCHSMVHRDRNFILSLEELKRIINNRAQQ